MSSGWTWPSHLRKPHGTLAAARRHYRRGEKLCRPCRQAETEYRRRRATPAAHYWAASGAACGHPKAQRLTGYPPAVTCGACVRTSAYRAAVA